MSVCFRKSLVRPFFKLIYLLIMTKGNQFLLQHSLDRLLQVMPLLQLENQSFSERQPPESGRLTLAQLSTRYSQTFSCLCNSETRKPGPIYMSRCPIQYWSQL